MHQLKSRLKKPTRPSPLLADWPYQLACSPTLLACWRLSRLQMSSHSRRNSPPFGSCLIPAPVLVPVAVLLNLPIAPWHCQCHGVPLNLRAPPSIHIMFFPKSSSASRRTACSPGSSSSASRTIRIGCIHRSNRAAPARGIVRAVFHPHPPVGGWGWKHIAPKMRGSCLAMSESMALLRCATSPCLGRWSRPACKGDRCAHPTSSKRSQGFEAYIGI